MDKKSFPTISYAECVKTSSHGKKQADEHTAPMSWYDQVMNYQNAIKSRVNLMTTILNDDAGNNCPQRSAIAMHRLSISHSMDSGQLSDLSSDSEQCPKSSIKRPNNANDGAAAATNTNIASSKQQRKSKHRKSAGRQVSIDSGIMSPGTPNCANPHCTRDHNQLLLMCQSPAANLPKVAPKYEYNVTVLERRQKQIDYGKNTLGYELYTGQVPRAKRTEDHPRTPDKRRHYSRRGFDALIRIWRKELHKFDPLDTHEATNSEWQKITKK